MNKFEQLASLRARLWARCENAYCDMISVARRDESLGWEIKIERGTFGRKELDSHSKIGELLGRHRALAEACRDIDEAITKMEESTSVKQEMYLKQHGSKVEWKGLEPKLIRATAKESVNNQNYACWDIVCEFSDGQKFAPVEVDFNFPELAKQIADFMGAS